jgi:hypothetical protein
VCFVTGEPSGLTVTLPKALAELKKAVPAGTPVMVGFDRGGACPQVFRHCREQQVHWVTYRRAPLAVPAMLPVLTAVTVGGKTRTVAWAEEKTQLKDYGEARQLTLSEHGRVVLQILTSDFDSCPAEILDWLKSRWREENFLKYASGNYGPGKICDYAATIETNTKPAANPASTAVRDAQNALAAAERALAALLADPDTTPAAKNKAIPAATRAITAAKRKVKDTTAARKKIPAKLPASQIDPDARIAAPGAAACRWCSGCSPATPSTGSPRTSTPTCATTTNTAPSPAKPSSAASPASSPSPPPRSQSPSKPQASPASPEH